MSIRRPGPETQPFDAQPETATDVTAPVPAPLPPPRRAPLVAAPDEPDEPDEPTTITTTAPMPADAPIVDDIDAPTAISTVPSPPGTPAPVHHRPGSGAIALDALLRQSGVERPLPPGEPDPFEAAATVVADAPDAASRAAWDDDAPTDVLTLPPRGDD